MTALATTFPTAAAIESVLVTGDLSALTESQRLSHYTNVCKSLGLNPLTQPFDYIRLNNKLVLYAKRDAAEQLRKLHGVSITEMRSEHVGDVFVVTVQAKDRSGRTDMSTGAVAIGNLKGEALANGLLKAETKAKRRVTLSICGLGILDETEVADIKDAHPLPPPLVVEVPKEPPPEGYRYIVRTDISEGSGRKGKYRWLDVAFDNGELARASGEQLMGLLQEMQQTHVPMRVTKMGKTSAGFDKIEKVETWKAPVETPAPPVEPLPVSEVPF